MGAAFLKLYEVTGERKWLASSEAAAKFIQATFVPDEGGGLPTSVNKAGTILKSKPLADENIRLARYSNSLFRYTGQQPYKKLAVEAMKFLQHDDVAERVFVLSGVLIADYELQHEPGHLTLVASKTDPNAKALWQTALQFPFEYRRLEWWDKQEGPLPQNDVTYPALPKAALFSCSANRCSLPAFDVDEVKQRMDSLKIE